jgi:hypothetical protein
VTLNKFRSKLYGSAKILGDVQAVSKAYRTGSFQPLFKRLARRLAGKVTGRFLGWLIK